ncbi:MAG: CCA tRNA nucleotidyltransferase [Bacillota bacterium]
MKGQFAALKTLYSLAEIRNIPVFVVGGTVRDLLLGRRITDLDVLIFGNVWKLAPELAQALEATWFVLDEQTQTARVVLHNQQSQLNIDLVGAGYKSLHENLVERDFTINAMAINLSDCLIHFESINNNNNKVDNYPFWGQLFDPLKGRDDLRAGILRVTGEKVFQRDPLRLLRAVRQSATLGLLIEKSTWALIKQQAGLISQSSPERVRDELFKILALNDAHYWMTQLDELGLLDQVLPELMTLKGVQQNEHHSLDVWGHCLATLEELEKRPWEGLLTRKIEARVNQFLTEEVVVGRSKWSLLKLAALLHDMGKPEVKASKSGGKVVFYGHEQAGARRVRQIADRIKLSSREKRILATIIDQHMRPFHLFRAKNHTAKAECRFFFSADCETISVLLLSIADRRAGRVRTDAKETTDYQHFIKILLEKYLDEFQPIREHRIIRGREIMTVFGLKPGPSIGKLLKRVEEAQVLGQIHTQEDALRLVGQILKNSRVY